MQVGLEFGTLLGRICVDFWVQVGRQVGAKLAPKSERIGYRKINQKIIEIKSCKAGKTAGVLAPKNPSGISKTTIPRVPGTRGHSGALETLHYRA